MKTFHVAFQVAGYRHPVIVRVQAQHTSEARMIAVRYAAHAFPGEWNRNRGVCFPLKLNPRRAA